MNTCGEGKKCSIKDVKFLDPGKYNVCNFNSYLYGYQKLGEKRYNYATIASIASGEIQSAINRINLLSNEGEISRVFVKATPHEEILQKSNALTEILLYRFLTLLKNYGILHFIPSYYMDFSCILNQDPTKPTLSILSIIIDSILPTKTYNWSNGPHHFMFLEHLPHPRFMSLYEKSLKSLDEREVSSIVFQLEYITHQFHLLGLRHNDLHLNNVMIEEFDTPQILVYYEVVDGGSKAVESKTYRFQLSTRYKVYVIDFDRATPTRAAYRSRRTISGVKAGSDGFYCRDHGACDYENEFFDLNIILGGLYHKFKDSSVYQKYIDLKYPLDPRPHKPSYFAKGGKFNRTFSPRLCRNKKNCDDPNWDLSIKNKDGSMITTHKNILKSIINLDILPGINFQKISPKNLRRYIECDRGLTKEVSVSIEIESPFKESLEEVIDFLYEKLSRDVKNVY